MEYSDIVMQHECGWGGGGDRSPASMSRCLIHQDFQTSLIAFSKNAVASSLVHALDLSTNITRIEPWLQDKKEIVLSLIMSLEAVQQCNSARGCRHEADSAVIHREFSAR